LFQLFKLSPVWLIKKVPNERVFFNEESDSVNSDENLQILVSYYVTVSCWLFCVFRCSTNSNEAQHA